MDYFTHGLKEYANFSGRERRKSYWMFILIYFLISVALGAIDKKFGTQWLQLVFQLALLIPLLSMGSRRLHDTGRTGWWQLLLFIPVLGTIILIIFFVLDSEQQENLHGSSPKYASAELTHSQTEE